MDRPDQYHMVVRFTNIQPSSDDMYSTGQVDRYKTYEDTISSSTAHV
jgi:hypothetical protein